MDITENIFALDEGPAAIRIEVKQLNHFVTWPKFKHVSGINLGYAHQLERDAISRGAIPKQWYASFKPIKSKDWVSIEIWDRETQNWINYKVN